jgi:hypothetical protein
VKQFLLPTLKPGDIVVMDNLSSHKGKDVRNAIRSAGAHSIFLPAYSPDPHLRGDKPQSNRAGFFQAQGIATKSPCTHLRSVSDSIGNLLNKFSPTECANYLDSAGYAST